jgi:hypothetical protein
MAAPTLIRLMPSRTPINHAAVTGRLAQRIKDSRIPISPLPSTQPHFENGRQREDDLRDTFDHEEDDEEQRDRHHPLCWVAEEQKADEHMTEICPPLWHHPTDEHPSRSRLP